MESESSGYTREHLVVIVVTLLVVGGLVGGIYWGVYHSYMKKVRPPVLVTWATSAREYRTSVSRSIDFHCPPGGKARQVWGTGVYTDDSSVCTAAVHAGLITFKRGGKVTITMHPGETRYEGSLRHGVRTKGWGRHGGSFFFRKARQVLVLPGDGRPAAVAPLRIPWNAVPTSLRKRLGKRFLFLCPPRGRFGRVWGSGPYTLDSSVCTAAVHGGVITRKKGGRVLIEITRGQPHYEGSLRHGVKTGAWKAFHTSFRVVGAKAVDKLPDLPTPQ